jgi:exonuclease III
VVPAVRPERLEAILGRPKRVTAKERSAVMALVDLGLVDVQPRAFKGRPFTYWDYQAATFTKEWGCAST